MNYTQNTHFLIKEERKKEKKRLYQGKNGPFYFADALH
jgi:hypothetical protein